MALALLAASVESAAGQSLTRGSLAGTVTDASELPLFDAIVTASSSSSGLVYSARTDRQGEFALVLIPSGVYEISFEHLGYRPLRIPNLGVRPGDDVELSAVLAAAPPPGAADAAPSPGRSVAAIRPADLVTRFDGQFIQALPLGQSSGGGYATFSSRLPGELPDAPARPDVGRVHLDGFAGSLRLPALLPPTWMPGPVPMDAVGSLHIVADPFDPEWPDGRGAVIHVLSSPGSEHTDVEASGGSAVQVEGFDSGDGGASASHGARVRMTGPIGQAGRFSLSGEGIRFSGPVFRPPPDSPAGKALQIASGRGGWGVAASPAAEAHFTGHARYDGVFRDRHQLTGFLRAEVASNVSALDELGMVRPFSSTSNRTGFEAGAAMTSELTEGIHQELRLAFRSARFDAPAAPVGEPSIPMTRISSLGLDFGAAPTALTEGTERGVVLQQTVHFRAGAHRFKAGVFADAAQLRLAYAGTTTREFIFPDLAGFELQEGWYRESSAAAADSDFALLRTGGFVQTSWSLGPQLTANLGGRVEVERVPWLHLAVDTARLAAFGLANADSLSALITRFSPRASISWRPARDWSVAANAGLFHQPIDARLTAELFRFAFGGAGRAGPSALSDWPVSPAAHIIPSAGVGSILLPLDYAPPRSARADLTIARNLGTRTVARIGVFAGRGALLSRRRDLNLLAAPWSSDQHGRPIFAPPPGFASASPEATGRRFAGYGPVIAIEGDGKSTERGATLAIDHTRDTELELIASLTLSRIRDDAPTDARLLPHAVLWGEGPGDLDVPQRAFVAAAWTPTLPLRPAISVLYRYDGGLPFTPRIRSVVDVNGDGDPTNDPAFIDPEIPGTQALLDAWPCLARQVATFAGRNSCRGSGGHSLALGVRLRSVQLGNTTADVGAEILHLLQADPSLLDTALYLVPAGSAIEPGAAEGTVVIPFVTNPRFGKPMTDRARRPTLRLGIEVRF